MYCWSLCEKYWNRKEKNKTMFAEWLKEYEKIVNSKEEERICLMCGRKLKKEKKQ